MLGLINSFWFPLCRRDTLSCEDTEHLASFLGEQLRNLHLLPSPPINNCATTEMDIDCPSTNGSMEDCLDRLSIPTEWDIFIRTLIHKKKDVSSRLTNWYVDAVIIKLAVGQCFNFRKFPFVLYQNK